MATTKVVTLESLTPDPANVRKHGDRGQAGIEASLRRFGPARSIVIDGKGVVRAGNGTLEAARAAGITDILVVEPAPGQLVAVRRGDWTPSEATGYGIADNRLTDLSHFDDDALADTLRALQSEDFDLAAVGFDPGEVDDLCDRLASDLGGDDDEEGDGPGAGDQVPLAIVLDRKQAREWEKMKAGVGIKSDTAAFVHFVLGEG